MRKFTATPKPPSQHCEARLPDGSSCPQITRERKPYCSEHVDRLGHVAWLEAELDRRAAEVVDLARDRLTDAPADSPVLDDILALMIEYGTAISLERMVVLLDSELSPLEDATMRSARRDARYAKERLVALKTKVVRRYLDALVRRGIGRWVPGTSRRGGYLFTLCLDGVKAAS